jgi:ATP-binding cassette, subfamily C (CFTR/MRP), member 1
LLSAILAEVPKVSGELELSGSVAYVPQTAWICHDTLKNNVLFGLPFDEKRFEAAIKASCLGPDISMLPGGVETEIGERGINLSGGQKQRVSIARAVYVDADVYLFDDPLSALDAEVGHAIFHDCLLGVLGHKTRIIALNQTGFLTHAHQIVVMNETKVQQVGNYTELAQHLAKFEENDKEDGKGQGIEEPDSPLRKAVEEPAAGATAGVKKKEPPKKAPGTGILVEGEERAVGKVNWHFYQRYFESFSSPGWIFAVITTAVLGQACQQGVNIWLSWWTRDSFHMQLGGYMLVYGALGLASGVFTYIRSIGIATLGVRGSTALHAQLYDSVLSSRLDWFDKTPVGRILNRFSQDLNIIDRMLPFNWGMCVHSSTMVLGCVIILAVVFPLFLVSVPFLAVIYRSTQLKYLESSRELKRMEALARSPVYASFSEALNGLTTIRAYGFQDTFVTVHEDKVEASNRAHFAGKVAVERWLALRLEMIGNVVIGCVAVLAVVQTDVPPALVGLALVYATQMTFMLGWTVRTFGETENMMNSVERVQEYIDAGDRHEATPNAIVVAESWPSQGRVEFQDLTVKYRADLEPAVSDLSFTVEPGQKVGVVGRTGAGKSSVMLALFRMVDWTGRILIDGVDIATVDLSVLRSHVSIIPQDPVLFLGTIKFNLDPFDEHTEDALWAALDKVHLKKRILEGTGNGIHEKVAEAGTNFSQGEIQLICIARAVLRGCKILVLDEATASVDDASDTLLQKTFRTSFVGCTMLTIAHRIKTIIDSDKILVLDQGRLVDFDTPAALLDQEEGRFLSLVQSSGQEEFLKAVVKGTQTLYD